MGDGERILVVEDEPNMLALTQRMLQKLGYDAVCAETPPAEAVDLVERGTLRFDLLLTDVVLPQMNGRQLAARIRAIAPGLRCLYMSGYTADIIARRGIVEESFDFIHKPFSLAEISVAVHDALRSPAP